MREDIRKILAIGHSVRHIVCSGSRAGYEMHAMDNFGDVDLRRCAKKYMPLKTDDNHVDGAKFEEELKEVDGVIIGAGFELKSELIKDKEKILGNSPKKMKETLNKEKLARHLDDLDIPHPATYTKTEIKKEIKSGKIRFPMLVKPIFGGGGIHNFLCNNEKELKRCIALPNPNLILQEYIQGVNASVSVISTKKEAFAVSVNEQLIGLDSLFSPAPFTYCGNISPFITKFSEKMCEIVELLVKDRGLIGSNGVDFVVTEDEAYVIEVNPRFQGSLDTVELSTGLNLVDTHVKAVKGKGDLPLENPFSFLGSFAARVIVFTTQNAVVVENMDKEGIVDIPEIGRVIKANKPIASGIGVGRSREEAFAMAMKHAEFIKRSIY